MLSFISLSSIKYDKYKRLFHKILQYLPKKGSSSSEKAVFFDPNEVPKIMLSSAGSDDNLCHYIRLLKPYKTLSLIYKSNNCGLYYIPNKRNKYVVIYINKGTTLNNAVPFYIILNNDPFSQTIFQSYRQLLYPQYLCDLWVFYRLVWLIWFDWFR